MNVALLARRDRLPAAGLVALYDFVQGPDPQVLYDRSGNGRHGALSAAPATPVWTPQGLVFDGVDDLVSVPTDPELRTQDLTIILLLSLAQYGKNTVVMEVNANTGWSLQTSSSPQFGARANGMMLTTAPGGAFKVVATSSAFVTGKPFAIAYTRIGVDATPYWNAKQDHIAAPFPAGTSVYGVAPLYIGGRLGLSGSFTQSTISALALYSRQLAPSEVKSAYAVLRRQAASRSVIIN